MAVRHVTHPRDPAQGPHRARSLPGEAGGRKLRGRDVAERVGPRERLALPAQEEEAAVLATAQQRRCLGDQAGPCFRCLRPRLREGKFGGFLPVLFFDTPRKKWHTGKLRPGNLGPGAEPQLHRGTPGWSTPWGLRCSPSCGAAAGPRRRHPPAAARSCRGSRLRGACTAGMIFGSVRRQALGFGGGPRPWGPCSRPGCCRPESR